MSRNGPIGHAGTRLPQRRHPAEDPFTAPPTGQPQWPPPYPEPQAQHGQYAEQPTAPGRYPEPAPQGQQPAPGYYFPQAAADPDPNYGFAQQPAPPQAQPLPFNRYAPQPQQDYAPAPQQHAQPAPSWGQQQPDPRGYDLGSYMPATTQGYAPADPAGFQQGTEPHFQAGLDPGRMGAAQHAYAESDAEFDDPLAEDEEEPRRGRRGLMIVAALVGAIGLGGALAYTYKTFIASSPGRAPLVRVPDSGPNKIKADGADGKSFAHTDKKLFNRLGDEAGPPRVAAAPPTEPDNQDERSSDDPNAPRKVRIIPIPPGNAAPAAPSVAPSGPPARPANAPIVNVPGLMIDNIGPSPQMPPPSAARAQMPPQQPPPARVQPQQAPPVIASVAPPAQPSTQGMAPPKKAPVVAAPAVDKKPVPKAKEAAAPKPKATPAPTVTGASGYVAVLASKSSRMDALKAFADLQQKYGDVLSSKTPDVQEANLGDKGLWYRAVVGPPGSREAASAVCTQLKTAGHAGCWVTAY